tara:strand:- start:191 stop:1114 length:924 start_codon:yes stop_codon:yes gene_type:complete
MKTICFIGKFNRICDEEGKALALERLGHKVFRFDENSFNIALGQDIDALMNRQPDYVFFTKLRVPYDHILINELKKRNVKTVCWMPDLYIGLEREKDVATLIPMFQADYVFSPDGGNQTIFDDYGVNHFIMHQGIHEGSCELIEIPEEQKKIDLLFVGSLHPVHGSSREKLLGFLSKTYKKSFFWAGQNNTYDFRDTKLTKLISHTKIVIGTSVNSPYYWSNRLYETLGRGGFLIHQYTKGIDEEYKENDHFVTFKEGNFLDLKEKIDYWLKKGKERDIIRKNAYDYTKENHTLYHRAEKIMEIIYA